MTSDITVIICTYNGAKYVRQQVSSILRQTVLPKVLLVSDDGSTGETLKEVHSAFAERPKLAQDMRLIIQSSQAQKGIATNLQSALSQVTTSLFAIADQDDVWLPNRLAIGISSLTEKIWLVGANAALVDSTLQPLNKDLFTSLALSAYERKGLEKNPLAALLRGNFLPGMTMLGKTKEAKLALPIPYGWLHDYWLALAAAAGGGLCVINEPLVLYRQHDRNQIGGRSHGMMDAIRQYATRRITSKKSDSVEKAISHSIDPRTRDWSSAQRLLAGSDPRQVVDVYGKINFENIRLNFSSSFLRRFVLACELFLRGSYFKYRRRWGNDFIHDLFSHQ